MDITTTTMAMGALASPSGAVAKLPLAADALATAQFSNLMAAPEITPVQPPVASTNTTKAALSTDCRPRRARKSPTRITLGARVI